MKRTPICVGTLSILLLVPLAYLVLFASPGLAPMVPVKLPGMAFESDRDGASRLEPIPTGHESGKTSAGERPIRSIPAERDSRTGRFVWRGAAPEPGALHELRARILDPDSTPIAGARAVLVVDSPADSAARSSSDEDETHEASSDATGTLVLHSRADGPFHLELSARGYLGRRAGPFQIEPSELLLELGPLILEPSTEIRGVVVDEHANPIQGARIEARLYEIDNIWAPELYAGERFHALSAADGSFRLEDLPRASFNLRARRATYTAEPVVGVPAGSAEQRIAMRRTASLSGTVFDPAGRAALLFAIHLQRRPQGYEPTPRIRKRFQNPEGYYRFSDLAPGTYTLHVEAPETPGAERRSIELTPGLDRQNVDVNLVAGSFARGVVLAKGKGTPVAGAAVVSATDIPPISFGDDWDTVGSLSAPCSFRTVTDASGEFELGPLSPGHHRLLARAEGHGIAQSARIAIAAGEDVESIELLLPTGGSIVGEARDAAGQGYEGRVVIAAPLAEATVLKKLRYFVTTTSADGRYKLDHLSAGAYFVALTGSNQAATVVETANVKDGETIRIDFLLQSAGTMVSGRVLDSRGAPLPGHTIMMVPLSGGEVAFKSAVTDGEGHYAIAGLDPGRHAIYLQQQARKMRLVGRLDIPAGKKTVEHDVRLSRAVLSGTVSERGSGKALTGARVSLLISEDGGEFHFAGSDRTDLDGSYRFSGVVPAIYQVAATGLDLGQEHTAAISVGDGDEHELPTLYLAPGGSAHFTVRDAQNRAIAGVYCDAVDATGRTVMLSDMPTLGPDGTLRAIGLRPGRYTLRVYLTSATSPSTHPFTITRGTETRVVFHIPN